MLSEARSIRSSPTRSSRSCHDSVNPCRAWARSPTTVKLRDGQRSSSICHSASVSSWASSTTTCANGPASTSGSALGSASSSTRASRQVLPAQHRHHLHLGVVGRDQVVDDVGHLLGARRPAAASLPAAASRRLRVAEPLPGGVEERQVGHGPGLRVRALQQPHLVGLEPGGAPAQVGRHRPQVADQVGRLEQRPGPVEGVDAARGSAPSARRSWSDGDLVLVVDLVDQDREQLLPDLVARLVVRRARVRRLERLGPVVGR